jgi:hypothetical protein
VKQRLALRGGGQKQLGLFDDALDRVERAGWGRVGRGQDGAPAQHDDGDEGRHQADEGRLPAPG